ncbi:hypothetical protein AXE65_08080 [Ventosimonas gracilis]|uniref:DNA (cytosine-5-)-methyltransferase n=1 Tax=Ventosimonas gracilis TaxID=1680762 RepID=A0A139SHF2_9GAMM|nr:hypothetical protein AXE65_08080 [Ventosimonas gracilis]
MNYLSLFSSIEAASQAWQPLGWQPVAFAEIEPFPCAVLAHHYPDIPNLGNVTEITDEQIKALGAIDVVVGGSPCQNLSLAGKRAGLAGAQSKLFHEQIRIFHAARHFCGARWLVWENVPGAFSSNGGADFDCVAGAMAGCRLDVPADGWGYEGMALGEHGLLEWAVLDAQWFGLAQRRKRVFAVLDAGNWQGRPPVLLERDSLRGDCPPRRMAQKSAANPAHASLDRAGCEQAVPEISMCLNAGAMGRRDAESETFVVHVCKTANTQSNGLGISNEGAAYTLDTAPNQAIAQDSGVRRLTPRECERLQGFPDDYTCIAWRGKSAKPCPDSPRYKALGNSMAVPVMRWIGQRIDAATKFEALEKAA